MSPIPSEAPRPIRREVINDLASGGLCTALALGLAVVHYSQTGRLHDNFDRDPGPALLPVILLITLGLSGVGMLIRGWLALPKAQRLTRQTPSLVWPAVAAVGLLMSFLPLRSVVGAGAALPLIGAALALLAGREDDARWPVTAALGAGAGFALYFLFQLGLSVPL